jgi:hypothetical protein
MSFGRPPIDRARPSDAVQRGRRVQSEPFLPPIFNGFSALASRAQQKSQPQQRKLQKGEGWPLGGASGSGDVLSTDSLSTTETCEPSRPLDSVLALSQQRAVDGLQERDPSRDESVFSDGSADDMSILSAASTARHSSLRQRSRSEGRCKADTTAARTHLPIRAHRALPQAQLELSIVADDTCANPPLSIEIESAKENGIDVDSCGAHVGQGDRSDGGEDKGDEVNGACRRIRPIDQADGGAEPSSAIADTRAVHGALYANRTGPLHGVVRLGKGLGSSAQFSLTATRTRCVCAHARACLRSQRHAPGVSRGGPVRRRTT